MKEIYTANEELNPRKPIDKGEFTVEIAKSRNALLDKVEGLEQQKLQIGLGVLMATKNLIKVQTLIRDTTLAENDQNLRVNYFINEVDNQLFTEVEPKRRFGFFKGGGNN